MCEYWLWFLSTTLYRMFFILNSISFQWFLNKLIYKCYMHLYIKMQLLMQDKYIYNNNNNISIIMRQKFSTLYSENKKQKKTKILIHTFSCVRFHTITLWPLLIKFFTIPLPMMPSPRKPNFRFDGRMFFSLRVSDIVSRSKGGVTCEKR